jgi:hypothetical protein
VVSGRVRPGLERRARRPRRQLGLRWRLDAAPMPVAGTTASTISVSARLAKRRAARRTTHRSWRPPAASRVGAAPSTQLDAHAHAPAPSPDLVHSSDRPPFITTNGSRLMRCTSESRPGRRRRLRS